MPEKKQPKEHGVPLWGIFLLFLGVVFLLQTLNILPWEVWGTLWRFWPVLLIIVGFSILLRFHSVWLVSVVILALLFACLGIAVWQYSSPLKPITTGDSVSLGNLERAQVKIDFTGGSLILSSLSFGSPNLVETGSTGGSGSSSVRMDFYRDDNEGRLYLSKEQARRPFLNKEANRQEVRLSQKIPLTIEVNSAASNVVLDLSQLQITELKIDIDLGNYIVKMSSPTGTIQTTIKTDLANLEVIIPEGTAARLGTKINLGNLLVDENRFRREDNHYVSHDLEKAKNRVELTLDAALSRVQVK